MSNVLRVSSELNLAPKNCMPSSAEIKIKSIRRTRRALMEAIELTRLFTRFPMALQCLISRHSKNYTMKKRKNMGENQKYIQL